MTAEEVQAFAPLPITLEADELLARVDAFLARGVTVESIFVDLLAPSARKIGQFWEDDVCDFVDVTMGLWRLQEVMREVAMRVPAVTQALCEPRTALFSPFPGEQHSFGALMVEEMFSRAGWESEALIEPQRQELLRVIGKRNFDLLGLTISKDCPSRALSDLINSARSVSKNPAIQIFIGGRVVNANPGLASEVGADGTAPDARSALALAERKVPGSRWFDLAVR
jgi:methanogenic corrinoid protein MtbC1